MKIKTSISPRDWEKIVAHLGDDTVRADNIAQWVSYSSETFPWDGAYEDVDYAAIGYVTYSPKNRGQKWFTVHAGCDTSGWGCLGDYAKVAYHKTYEDAVRNGLTKESRRWLGLELEGE